MEPQLKLMECNVINIRCNGMVYVYDMLMGL